VGVPIWCRGEVVGVNVVFAGRRRRFTAAELHDVEVLSQGATPALVRAGVSDPLLARLFDTHTGVAGDEPHVGRQARGDGGESVAVACRLTDREEQVLKLLAGGLSDREMAARLIISPKTVHKHVGAVLRKTGTASRTAAVMWALEAGWLSSR